MAKEKLTKANAMIEEIGYHFTGHYSHGGIRIQIVSAKGHCAFILNPNSKVLLKFLHLFRDEVSHYEDGFYIEELKGKYFTSWINEDRMIVGFSDILDEEGDEIVMLNEGK